MRSSRTSESPETASSSAEDEPFADEDCTVNTRATYLFVTPWSVTDVGGVNQVVLNLYHEFQARGVYTPRLLVMSWSHVRAVTILESGRAVTYMRIRAPVASAGPARALAKWAVFLFPDLSQISRFYRSHCVDFVNVHYPSLAALQFVLAGWLCRRRPKLILSFHGLDLVQASRSRGLERWMWKLLLRQADAVVTCSNAFKGTLLAFEPTIAARATVVHNGANARDLIRSRNMSARLDSRLQGRRFILSVASYEFKKGLDTLLLALKSVREEHHVDAALALVGPDLGVGDELKALAIEIGVSEHAIFCGPIPHRDLHVYYEAAEIFCLPSRWEPFGIVLLEAGVFRCPVVATCVGGIPEILEHDVNARLVSPDDPVVLAAELQRLLGDKRERERLSNALYERVQDQFAWAKAHRSYMRLLYRIARTLDISKQASELAGAQKVRGEE